MVALALVLPFGCTYDNEEEQNPETTDCTIGTVSYLTDIKPILQSNCYSCHNATLQSGNIALDSHAGLLKVSSSRLLPAINHEPGHPAMPQGGDKLPACDIAKITKWVNAGSLNN